MEASAAEADQDPKAVANQDPEAVAKSISASTGSEERRASR